MYLTKFDEEGRKIASIPVAFAEDYGGIEK